jgi:hypothetical protein
VLLVCLPFFAFSQDIVGLWKGTMFNDSTRQTLEYEIVISKEKGKYSGYSHTWFMIDAMKYYGIKKLKIKIAEDGKIVMLDEELLQNNYPMNPHKNVRQLNILDLTNPKGEMELQGIFVTNHTKKYKELTGHINIKKVSALTQSDLLKHFEKVNGENSLTILK